jgi:hypothetical protein
MVDTVIHGTPRCELRRTGDGNSSPLGGP